MWFWKFSQALSLCVLGVGFAMGPGASSSGLLLQLLSTGAPAWAVEQALEWGADPNAESAFVPGRNALHLAAEVGTVDQLELVARRARDLDAMTSSGETALTLALQREDWLARLRVLLGAGAGPGVVDARGRHPVALVMWQVAAPGGTPDEVMTGLRLLLEYGVDLDVVRAAVSADGVASAPELAEWLRGMESAAEAVAGRVVVVGGPAEGLIRE